MLETMSRSCRDCRNLDEYNGTFSCDSSMFTMYSETVLDLAESCSEYKPLLTWVVCWTGGRESLLRTQSEAREVAESRQKQDRRGTKYWIEEVY